MNGQHMPDRLRDRWIGAVRDDEGAIALMVVVLIVLLLAFAAVTVDAGAMYAERRQMQTAADAAALAGVQQLPGDPGGAVAMADNYASINSPEASDNDFSIGSTFVANDTITAELLDPAMGLFFARAIGRDTTRVDAQATAIIGSPRTYGEGVMPIGIMATGTVDPPYGYDPGQEIVLIPTTEDALYGNWHFVKLHDEDPNLFTTLEGGSQLPISIGDEIKTEPGSPTNPAYRSLNSNYTCSDHDFDALLYDAESGIYEPTHLDGTDCGRLLVLPVVVNAEGSPYEWDIQHGRSQRLIVVGFVNMLITNTPDHKDPDLVARFVQVVPESALDPGGYIDYGGVVYWLAE